MTDIPNKIYFRIGEVSRLIAVEPYVLRYWESEFPDIKPSKSKSGQRLYRRKDVEILLKIKELLYEERYTIDGAKRRLKDFGKEKDALSAKAADIKDDNHQMEAFPMDDVNGDLMHTSPSFAKILQKVKRDLESVLHILNG